MNLLLLTSMLSIHPAAAAFPARVDRVTGEVFLSSGAAAKEAIVFLEGKDRAAPLTNAVIDQRDKKFTPHVSVVTVGTKVQFPNHDVVFHNVFTEYHSDRFDLGMYPRGASKSQVFDRPGLAVLLCNIHPYMSAYIMCVDTPFYAVADSRGQFRIDNVPDGVYTAHVWQESGETLTQKVEVGSAHKFSFRTRR
jgi:plastocyanin